ncbi:conserved protein of unknown function [Ruminococcaceae bacterium BL-4]|nr:conserved protein of unknown function [Ruminococcaceae bacterium BL-4]
MENDELTNSIENWEDKISHDKDLSAIAIMNIYTKMEKYFTKMFIMYASGEKSSAGYVPRRRLCFEDESHLINFLKLQGGQFIDYMKIIENFTKFIFVINEDPFLLVFSDSKFYNVYKKSKIIRNYVAHESAESKNLYIKDCLCIKKLGETSKFIEPNKYLLGKKKGIEISRFTYFVNEIAQISNVIIDPRKYF